jgi:hypothetical protein
MQHEVRIFWQLLVCFEVGTFFFSKERGLKEKDSRLNISGENTLALDLAVIVLTCMGTSAGLLIWQRCNCTCAIGLECMIDKSNRFIQDDILASNS